MSTCRSCDALISWAVTEPREDKPSRRMPLDADESGQPKVVESGNLVVLGRDASNTAVVRYVKAGEGRHVSHFSTCPNSAQHRKR